MSCKVSSLTHAWHARCHAYLIHEQLLRQLAVDTMRLAKAFQLLDLSAVSPARRIGGGDDGGDCT